MEERDSMAHRNLSARLAAAPVWEKAETAEGVRIRLEKEIGKAAGRPALGRIPGPILRECQADPTPEDAIADIPAYRRDTSRAAEGRDPGNGRP